MNFTKKVVAACFGVALFVTGCQSDAASSEAPKVRTDLPATLILSFEDNRFDEWEAFLPILKKYNAHASFFITSWNSNMTAKVKKLVAEGHSVGLHGWRHRNVAFEIGRRGRHAWFAEEILPALDAAHEARIPVPTFAYPNVSSAYTDAILLSHFDRICGDLGPAVRGYNSSSNVKGLKPLTTDDRVFFPANELYDRRRINGVYLGSAYHVELEDALACVRRAAERKEAFMFMTRGVSANGADVHVKTDFLESVLAEAKKVGVRVIGMNELPAIEVPAEKRLYNFPLPKNVQTIDVGGSAKIKTLDAAFARALELRQKNKKLPLAIRVAAGEYSLTKPLEITNELASEKFGELIIYPATFTAKPVVKGSANLAQMVKMTGAAKVTLAGLVFADAPNGLVIDNSSRIQVVACAFSGVRTTPGVGVSIDGFDVQVKDCDISNFGSNGVVVKKNAKMKNRDSRQSVALANNHIFLIGEKDESNFAIQNEADSIAITHNLIHDIAGGALAGVGRDNDVSFNLIHRVFQGTNTLAEVSGVINEKGAGHYAGSRVSNNTIYEAMAERACGIYFAKDLSGLTFANNTIAKCRWSAIYLGEGNGTVISNNVFAMNGTNARGQEQTQVILNGAAMKNIKFVRNVVDYAWQPTSFYLSVGALDLKKNTVDENLCWPGSEKPVKVRVGEKETDVLDWTAWLARGGDKNTLVASPVFFDVRNNNYFFLDESNAHPMKITQPPYDEIGLQYTVFRPELPRAKEGFREPLKK